MKAKRRAMSYTPPMIASLHVAFGGALGALLRYQVGRGMTAWLGPKAIMGFPWATLTVNILGSLAMGLLAGWLARHGDMESEQLRLFIGVGLLGGFTTFSAFSLEMMVLIERGDTSLALGYSLVSVLAGVTALYVGLIVMRIAG